VYSGSESTGRTHMDREKSSELTQAQQFRMDVIEALSAIDTEIDALQQAIKEGKVVTSGRLKELRAETRQSLWKFRDFHVKKIGRL
jgi:hypothetical protein